jgi:uncharacterized membrane protein
LAIAALFLTSGVCHFLLTPFFVAIMPPYLPWHEAAVYVSGGFELAGALGLLMAHTRRSAGLGLFVLTVLVTPANVHMAVHPELYPTFSETALILRLPLQALLLALIYYAAIRPPSEGVIPAHSPRS